MTINTEFSFPSATELETCNSSMLQWENISISVKYPSEQNRTE